LRAPRATTPTHLELLVYLAEEGVALVAGLGLGLPLLLGCLVRGHLRIGLGYGIGS